MIRREYVSHLVRIALEWVMLATNILSSQLRRNGWYFKLWQDNISTILNYATFIYDSLLLQMVETYEYNA